MLKLDLKNMLSFQNSPLSSQRTLGNSATNATRTSPRDQSALTYENRFPQFDYPQLKSLLTKQERSLKDACTIYEELKDFELFKAMQNLNPYNKDILIRVCQSIKYKQYDRGSAIYRENDVSDGSFFLVLSGEVSLIHRKASNVSNPKVEELIDKLSLGIISIPQKGEDNKPFPLASDFSNDSELVKMLSFDQEKLILKLIENDQLLPSHLRSGKFWTKKLSISEQADEVCKDIKQVGSHFGHNLLHKPSRRTEEAITATPCEVIILPKEAAALLKGELFRFEEEKYYFMTKVIPGLEALKDYEAANMLISLFQPVRLTRGQCLTVEGEFGYAFYVIKEGEFEVMKNSRAEIESIHYMDAMVVQEKTGILKYENQEMRMYVLKEGEIVGEEIVFKNSGRNEYTIRVTSPEALVYEMDRAKFAFRFPEKVFKSLCNLHERKTAKYSKTFQDKLLFSLTQSSNLMPKKFATSPEKRSNLPAQSPNRADNASLPPIQFNTNVSALFTTPRQSPAPGRLAGFKNDLSLLKAKVPKISEYGLSSNPTSPTMPKIKSPRTIEKLGKLNIMDPESYRFKVEGDDEREERRVKLNKIRLGKFSPSPASLRSFDADKETLEGAVVASLLLKKPEIWAEQPVEDDVQWYQKSMNKMKNPTFGKDPPKDSIKFYSPRSEAILNISLVEEEPEDLLPSKRGNNNKKGDGSPSNRAVLKPKLVGTVFKSKNVMKKILV